MRKADVIAGLSVSGLMLPEAVAYAAIAGLPPGRAIFAGIAGCLAYALVGRSPYAILSPTSSAAAILAGLLALSPVSGTDKAFIATAATLLAGGFFLVAALLRLGGLSALVPRPVLKGFAFGIALTIIIKQVPAVVGVPAAGGNLAAQVWALVSHMRDWHVASLGCGVVALGLYGWLRRVPAVPGALLVLLAGALAGMALPLDTWGVAAVGRIAAVPAWPVLPVMGLSEWTRLASFVVPLTLILLAESWGTVSALAAAHGGRLDANRELAGFGVANMASALVQGMPVGAGFSAGSAAEAAGAATRVAAVVAALALAGLVFLAGPVMEHLPQPVLAAVVIGTLAHALSFAPFVRFWRLRRDFWLAVATAVAVLGMGVLNGMLLSVALSLAGLLHRLMSPRLARLGMLNGSRAYVDMARHPDARAPEGVVIWRPAEPLFYANAAAVLDAIAGASAPGARAIVLSLEETFDLDSTTLDALVALDRGLTARGLRLQLARVHDHVRDVLAAAGETGLIARSSYSVDDAVAALGAGQRAGGGDGGQG